MGVVDELGHAPLGSTLGLLHGLSVSAVGGRLSATQSQHGLENEASSLDHNISLINRLRSTCVWIEVNMQPLHSVGQARAAPVA